MTSRTLFLLLLIPTFFLSLKVPECSKLKCGVYGIYFEPERYERVSILERRNVYYSVYHKPWQELTIKADGTFSFFEIYGECMILELFGKWKCKKNVLLLYAFKNSKSRPIPTKFQIYPDSLCALNNTKLCYPLRDSSRR